MGRYDGKPKKKETPIEWKIAKGIILGFGISFLIMKTIEEIEAYRAKKQIEESIKQMNRATNEMYRQQLRMLRQIQRY